MSTREAPLCRYFAQSTCRNAECAFRHELPPRGSQETLCRFYQAGSCAYGAKCRFNHVKVKPDRAAVAPTRRVAPPPPPPPPARVAPAARPEGSSERAWADVAAPSAEQLAALRLSDEQANASQPASAPAPVISDPWRVLTDPGAAPREPDEQAEVARAARSEALLQSAGVECAVCLEVVLSKPTPAERRFGLLEACSHAFCLPCIRGWRSGAASDKQQEHGRTCPICRTPSFYIVPSATWPVDEAAKAQVVETYRLRLSAIPCRHFDQGRGSCPFSTSCWYAHRLADGREAAQGPLRWRGGEDGEVRVVEPVRLSAFLAAQ